MTSQRDVDGGWAWFVLGASYFNQLVCSGLAFVAGMFQVIFLEEFSGSVAFTSWVTGLFSSLLQLAGPLASAMANRFGCRTSVMLGGILISAGFVISGLVNSLQWLMVSFGAVAGLGMGLTYTPSIIVISFYFHKRRTLINGIASSAGGLGILLAPQISQILLDNFSWRETLFVLAGVSAHVCIAGALMFPAHEGLKTNECSENKANDCDDITRSFLTGEYDRQINKNYCIDVESDNMENQTIYCGGDGSGKPFPNGENSRDKNNYDKEDDTKDEVGDFDDNSTKSCPSGDTSRYRNEKRNSDSQCHIQKHNVKYCNHHRCSELFQNGGTTRSNGKNDTIHLEGEIENINYDVDTTVSENNRVPSGEEIEINEVTPRLSQCDSYHWDNFDVSSGGNLATSENRHPFLNETIYKYLENKDGNKWESFGSQILDSVSAKPFNQTPLQDSLHKHKQGSQRYGEIIADTESFSMNCDQSSFTNLEGSKNKSKSCPEISRTIGVSRERMTFPEENGMTNLMKASSRHSMSSAFDTTSGLRSNSSTSEIDDKIDDVSKPKGQNYSIQQNNATDFKHSFLRREEGSETLQISAHSERKFSGPKYPKLYKNRIFMVLCLALFVNSAGSGCFLIHVPSFLKSRGLSDWEITNVLSMNGVAILLGRCLIGALVDSQAGHEALFLIAMQVIGGLFMVLYPQVGTSYASCMGVMFAIASYCGTFYSLLPTLTIVYVGLASLTTAFGIEMVSCGLGFLIAPPLAVWQWTSRITMTSTCTREDVCLCWRVSSPWRCLGCQRSPDERVPAATGAWAVGATWSEVASCWTSDAELPRSQM